MQRNTRLSNLLLSLTMVAVAFSNMRDAAAYNLYGTKMPSTNATASFPPDGTSTDTGAMTNMFAATSCGCTPADWQRQFAIAFQAWAKVTPLNYHFVADSGVAWGTAGQQGVARGSGYIFSGTNASYAGYAYYPSGSLASSDLWLNTSYNWTLPGKVCGCSGSQIPMLAVLEHEIGHTIGLGHSTLSAAIMYPTLWGQGPELNADDIAGAQALYGARQPDAHEPNDGTAAATILSSSSQSLSADITTTSDVDTFKLTMPGSGSLTVNVKTSLSSLLPPKLMIYDTAGNLVASATGDYSKDITATLSSVAEGNVYYATVMGDNTNPVPAIGTYVLEVNMPSGTTPPPPPPPPPPTPSTLTPSKTSVSFGRANVGSSQVAEVYLSNTGSSSITITQVTAPVGFTASCSATTLNPNQQAKLDIRFTPTAAVTYSGNVTITSNASNSPLNISVSGTGKNSRK